MSNLTLKGLPDEVHRRLKARARKHGRSLNKEAIACLEEAVRDDDRMTTEEWLTQVRELRAKSSFYLTDADIRRGIEWGRK